MPSYRTEAAVRAFSLTSLILILSISARLSWTVWIGGLVALVLIQIIEVRSALRTRALAAELLASGDLVEGSEAASMLIACEPHAFRVREAAALGMLSGMVLLGRTLSADTRARVVELFR